MSVPLPSSVISAAMLRWLYEHGDRGVFCTDTALKIQSWNRWLAASTGYTVDQVIGRPLFEVFPSLTARGLDQFYAEALGGEIKILAHSLHRFVLPSLKEPQMPQRGQIGPLVEDGAVVGTITIVEDVTERVATERELRARISTAEHARTIAETASRVKDEFLATLSHEIRTPLNAVLGWTRILRSRECDRATLERAVEVIDRNATAQLTLISDMLDMARIATGKVRLEMTALDVGEVALAAMDVVRPAADAKGVQLVADVATDLPPVSGDRDRILQVVWNLLSNAVKFTDSGGRVSVSVSGAGSFVRLAVADTGHGIAPEFRAHVFERFKQADSSSARRHGGLGLGLALVRELVELHGGTVGVASEGVGRGSTFTVVLPARVGQSTRSELAPAAVVTTPSLEQLALLVVEDDPDAREILVHALTAAGASVTSASSAAEAIELLRRNPTCFRAVVTDIGMPDGDGYALLREMRKLPAAHGGTLPAVAVSAYASAVDRSRALQAGFAAHISKPYAPDVLIAAIGRAVGSAVE